MLWNVVYDFFIKYIFGGYTTDGNMYDAILPITNQNLPSTRQIKFFEISAFGQSYALSLGNYFSLIATIISMVAIVLICCAFVKKVYNMCAHIIG